MARVLVRHGIDDLASDLAEIPARAVAEMRGIVREGAQVGNSLAKDFARESSGTHARKYPGTFSAEMLSGFVGFGSRVIQAEYGPRATGQGLLAPILENGSRHNKPHFNLARSADIIGPALLGEVDRAVERWFW
jgi:hypothetical protein